MENSSPAALFADHLATVVARTAAALSATGHDALLLHSGSPPMVFQDDFPYPFRVQAPFKVWAPLLDTPDCFIFFRPGEKPRLLFHQPVDYWHKPGGLPEDFWAGHFDLRAVPDLETAREALPEDLSGTAFLGDTWPGLGLFATGAMNPPALVARLNFERARKTPYELAQLRLANQLGARGHLAAARAFAGGASEFEIELAFLDATQLREQELPYNPIIAHNEGGAVLHYQLLNRRPPPVVHSLLIDAGAESGGYASDITRTYAHSDAEFAALIGQMDELQQTLCGVVRAGVDWRDVHLTAHRLIAELLRDAGIIDADAEEAVASGLSSVFFPHGLGHLLGLQVHDMGGLQAAPEGGEIPRPADHPYLRLTRILEEGFVVTMEPGIYFIDQLLDSARSNGLGKRINWARVASLQKFGGIRIEDNLAVTASGSENLTRDAFRSERVPTRSAIRDAV